MISDARKRLCQLALISTLLLSLLSSIVSAQGSNIGQEVVVTYSGTTAQLVPPNTPATNFSTAGTNTFILSVGSTVSVRVYLTNNTANSCAGFSIQMFAATDASTNSFNNALQNWQTVPLQTPVAGGGLVPAVTGITLPANGAVYVTSAAIQAPKVTIQILNTGGCTTTNMEAVAYISPVSVTSPLVSASSSNVSGSTGYVQGVQPQNYNGNALNPVMIGGAALPTNSGFLAQGVDCVNSSGLVATVGSGFYNVGVTPCATQGTPELALMFETQTGSPGGTSINSPWQCSYTPLGSSACGTGGSGLVANYYNNAVPGTPLIRQLIGSLGVPAPLITIGMTFKQGTARQFRAGGGGSVGFANTTLAGSVLLWAVFCSGATVCQVTGSSAIGATYAQVNSIALPGATNGNLQVWVSNSATAGGFEVITFGGAGAASILSSAVVEISNPATSLLVSPTTIIQTDLTGRQIVAQDAQQPNLWTCTVTLSTNTTTLCEAAPTTIAGQAVRPYVTDYVINTTTAGTATTIQLIGGSGSNCGTSTVNLSAIAYPNTAIAITTIGPFRTPLFGSLQTQVCAKQAGTTAGTSVVEIHGFWAP